MGKQQKRDTAQKIASSQFSSSLLSALALIVLASITFGIYVYWEKRIDQANGLRINSILLSDELRQSSDDLTRMVRTYVVTGDPIYKQHYQEILDIRDGKRACPIESNDIYWDLVLKDDRRPRPNGPAIPLLERMRQAGFTKNEFDKLQQAKANSDELTRTEFAAMALIESKPITESKRLRTIWMLNDDSYHRAKADIMRPISEFSQLMNQRTIQAVQNAEQTALLLRYVFIALALLLVFMLWRVYRALHATLGCSVRELQEQIVRLGKGDLSSRISVPQDMKNSVLGWLSVTQANLARIDVERKQAEENARELAFYDSLTNLPNRRLFTDRFGQAMLASKRSGCYGALMVLDLDNFKPLNDTYGHVIGDLLLIEVAHRLKSCVREIDTVVRFGGDEFIVMLVDLAVDSMEATLQAEAIAEKIRSKLSNPYQLTIRNGENANTEIEYRCTVSIGIVMFIKNEKDRSEDDLFRYADAAMYQAKAAGRNTIRFSTLKP